MNDASRGMQSKGLLLLACLTAILVCLKAAGIMSPAPLRPCEIADRFLAEARRAQGDGASSVESTSPAFTDVAAELGVSFVHDNAARGRYLLPEEMGPGAGFLDYDGDGDLDIFIAGGGAIIDDGPPQHARLFRNDGLGFADVTEACGAGLAGPAYGVACADYDNDGDVDIFVSRLGPNALLRNDGHGRFEEVGSEAGVADPGFGTGAAFLDYDRDGRLDLYVANYVNWSLQREVDCFTILGLRDYCGPTVYKAPSQDRLYRNAGDGLFEDVSDPAGISSATGQGLGVLASDVDGDGWVDIYVANDQTPAFLWHNRGDGTFEDLAALNGCAYDRAGTAIAGMGVACEDLDGDEDFDLVVTNILDQGHLVLRNDSGRFNDASVEMGTGPWSIPVTTFGIGLFDQDNDGRLDAYLANGDVNMNARPPDCPNPYAQPDHFVRLIGGRFRDATTGVGVPFRDVGRAVACGDYDNDGDLDLLVTNNGGPVRLLRNNNPGDNAWLTVRTRLLPGGRDAIGARLRLEAGGRSFVREIRPQQSYLSSGDPRAHFGLGRTDRVDRLTVTWPDGSVTELRDLAVNRHIIVNGPSNGGGDA